MSILITTNITNPHPSFNAFPSPSQIIVSMKIIEKSKQLLVLCPNGIYLFNLSNRTRTHTLVNKHEKELTCMTYHKARDLLMTGQCNGR